MHGVYKYEVDGKVIYIGKTDSDFTTRISWHRREKAFAPYLSKAKIFVQELKDVKEADFVETLLINQYKPELNKAKKEITDVQISVDMNWLSWDEYKIKSQFKYPEETKSKRLYLLAKPSVHEKLDKYAKANGDTFNNLVHTLMEDFIERKGL